MGIQIVLTGLAGREAGREFVVPVNMPCLIGRSRRCSVSLEDDPTVSRQHCLLEREGSVVRVRDLGSKNGTYLNGEKLGAGDEAPVTDVRIVQNGDYIAIGHNAFLVNLVEKDGSSQEAILRAIENPN
jgi:eukaryotic-like serine/threonine-protein kinase